MYDTHGQNYNVTTGVPGSQATVIGKSKPLESELMDKDSSAMESGAGGMGSGEKMDQMKGAAGDMAADAKKEDQSQVEEK